VLEFHSTMRGIYIDTARLAANASALQRALEGRVHEAVAELREAVVETAIETAQALAARTFPAGYGFALAKKSLLWELSTLYATGGRAFKGMKDAGEGPLASKFYRAYKSGRFSEARAILQMSGTSWKNVPVGRLEPSLHERSRDGSTGHINVRQPLQIVPTEDLASYGNLAVKRLGKTASGWLACAEQLGGNGNTPKWKGTAMHGPDGGHVEIHQTSTGFVVRMFNTRPLARKHSSPGQVAAIERRARRSLMERLVTGKVMKRLGRRAA
jgi:hypothetical protein